MLYPCVVPPPSQSPTLSLLQFSGRKEMVGVAIDDGTRRRLPPWMLGVAANNQVMKSSDRDENNNSLEDGNASQASNSNAKKQPGIVVMSKQKGALGANSNSLSKCETKRGKRKSSQQEAEGDGNIPETALDKKKYNGLGRKVSESAPQRKRKARSDGFRSVDFSGIQSPVDDAQDLTVEDLLSIAEEYVEADKDTRIQKSSNRECGSVNESPTLASLENDSGDCFIASENNQRPLVHNRICDSTVSLTSEQNIVNASGTGETTQDMLDLFLGPLLKKPVQEKKTEFITKDMESSYEFRKPSQNDVGAEIVLLKKKSSLKEKVSILLD